MDFSGQGFYPQFSSSTLPHDVFGALPVKRELDVFHPALNMPAAPPGIMPSRELIIATADHETLTRTKNPAYMQLLDYAQRLKTTNDNQTILGHYERFLNQGVAMPSHHHSQVSTPAASSSATPFHTRPSSTNSTPPSASSQAATYASIPVVPLVPHPTREEYPRVKFWFKSEWTDNTSSTADKGVLKTEAPPPDLSSLHKKKSGNKKLSFMEDEMGALLGWDEMEKLSKACYGLFNDLVRILGDHYPHTWAVAGSRCQDFVIHSLFNKFLPFCTCDGRWKGDEYCSVKFYDWARNGIPTAVKAEKALLKRDRQELKNRKNLPALPPGTVVLSIDDENDDDCAPPPSKKIKTEVALESKSASTIIPPVQAEAPPPLSTAKEKKEKKQCKSTLGTITIPPINSSIAVPVITPPAAPIVNPPPSAKPAPAPKKNGRPAKKDTKASVAAPAAEATKKPKYIKPTKTMTTRNLFLADYIENHRPVTAADFKTIYDKAMADIKEKLAHHRHFLIYIEKWEKIAFAAKEAVVKPKPAKKSGRNATKPAQGSADEQLPAVPAEPVEEDEVSGDESEDKEDAE